MTLDGLIARLPAPSVVQSTSQMIRAHGLARLDRIAVDHWGPYYTGKPHLRLRCVRSGTTLFWFVQWGEGCTTALYYSSGDAIKAARLYFT